MTIRELKKIIKSLDKNTVVKVNGMDIQVTISMDQDGKWSLNLTTPAATSASETLEVGVSRRPGSER